MELDERANRLANHMRAVGVSPGDHVGLQLANGSEYLEGMLASFKLRAVPLNVNFRYTSDELRYLFRDANLIALVHHRRFAPAVAEAAEGLSGLRHVLVVEDGSGEPLAGGACYEEALAAQLAERPAVEGRSGDDLYIAYTGGTTGMPKGVMWRHEDLFFAALGGGDPMVTGDVITRPGELAGRLDVFSIAMLIVPPFMHASGHWSALITLFAGGKVVVTPHGAFDPDMTWRLVAAEHANMLTIVGDAMGRPLLDTFASATAAGEPYDASSLRVIASGGALLSASTKDRVGVMFPDVVVIDGFGSSETGSLGTQTTMGATPAPRLRLPPNPAMAVLDADGRPIPPGSGRIGQVARRGHVPLGYHNDPAKTASTFVTVDGVRWALSGDMASVEDDGTILLRGRGSQCINTGGEKVYAEEVESTLKLHADVADAVVVGVPDQRWGQRVVAIVQPRPGTSPRLHDLQATCREHLAGYKVPRQVVMTESVVRSPSGKPDYGWAVKAATAAALPHSALP